jgi:pimeloyl-ACP methyl ester carboxylesterase
MRARLRYYIGRFQQRMRRFKRRTFGDEGIALSLDMESDSSTLLVTFGGMKSLAGIASFEFVNLTREFPVKRLFVRDPRQSWYHRGLPSHERTLAELAGCLREIVDQHGSERVVVAGNSAGGYAALLFGTLLGADVVLAFAPQTVIDSAILEPLVRRGALEEEWVDLGRALPPARRAATRYEVYYDETLPVERLHAERLVGLEGLRLYRFGRGGHELVRSLRDCGALERILRRALDLEPPAGAPGTADSSRARADDQPQLTFQTYG